jgi:hypothetical protein
VTALAQPCPPLCCDICELGMSASEIVRNEDGSIPGLLVCSLCVEDALEARQLETAQ